MKVLNFGSLNIDYVYHVAHFMKPGETQASQRMEVFCGGKGLNQSIALSRRGAQVWHAGAVGKPDGEQLLTILKESGVNTDHVKTVNGNSGHAIIQKDPSGQNSILLYGGANQEIESTDVEKVMALFDKGDFLILQNEIACMAEIMEAAHQKGLTIVFNPSPMNSAVKAYPLHYVDYFLLNEVEAGDMCGLSTENGEALIEKMAEMFPRSHCVLTLGDKGALYRHGDTVLRQGIYPTEVVDTTAAGDTFTGFFIGSILCGDSVEKALQIASKASAIAVSRAGAGPSIPHMKEVLTR